MLKNIRAFQHTHTHHLMPSESHHLFSRYAEALRLIQPADAEMLTMIDLLAGVLLFSAT